MQHDHEANALCVSRRRVVVAPRATPTAGHDGYNNCHDPTTTSALQANTLIQYAWVYRAPTYYLYTPTVAGDGHVMAGLVFWCGRRPSGEKAPSDARLQ